MTLGECCQKTVVDAPPAASVLDAARLMEEKNVGCAVITEDGRPVGILTDRDIVLRVVAAGKDPASTPVREVMTGDPMVLPESTGLLDAMKAMEGKSFRRIPVVNARGRLAGIVTVDDLLRLLVRELALVTTILEKEVPRI